MSDAMKERPLNAKPWEVRAFRDGRKTQFRRVVKQVPHWPHCGKDIMKWGLSGCYTDDKGRHWLDIQTEVDDNSHDEIKCPYGQPGDRLWVRETWRQYSRSECACYDDCHCPPSGTVLYRADHDEEIKWRPSIFMPRWASRLLLEIVSVRVERLQEISILDSHAEGVGGTYGETGIRLSFSGANHEWDNKTAIEQYAWLWDSINGPGAWDANPWVWVVGVKP